MNPIFRLIDWLLREHGTFVSGLFVYVAVPFIAWHLGRRAERKKTKGQPHLHLGYTTTYGAVGSSARHSVGNRAAQRRQRPVWRVMQKWRGRNRVRSRSTTSTR